MNSSFRTASTVVIACVAALAWGCEKKQQPATGDSPAPGAADNPGRAHYYEGDHVRIARWNGAAYETITLTGDGA